MENSPRGQQSSNERSNETTRNQKKRNSKTISDIYSILGPHSPYYIFSLTLNAMMFAIFNHLNEMDNFLIYTEEDQVYTDDRGRIVAPEHPTVINKDGMYATSNGAMDLTTLTILNNISSMVGCVVAILIARWSYHKSIITFTVLIVASYLLSQAFLFNFFDRIAFVVGSILSKSLSIITIQAAFESGRGKYRTLAIGLSYYLSHSFVFVTILLFKRETQYAETHFMFIITGFTALYALLSPPQLLHSIVREDVKRVKRILDKFGSPGRGNIDIASIVDDALYVNIVPRTASESLGYIFRIRPFVKKLIVLTIMVAIQTRLNSGEMEMIKTMIPYSPMESILISRVTACFAAIFAIYCICKIGRRRFLITVLFFNLLFSYIVSLVPIDTYYSCYSSDRPGPDYDLIIKISFVILTAIRTSLTITIFLLTLEHIPTIHRSFVFPVVMLFDSIITSISDASPYMITDLHDHPQFIRPMLRYSMIALLIGAIFIENTDVSVFHTNEIPCYNLTNAEKKKKNEPGVNDFEEKYRVLCEVKALEVETFMNQQSAQNVSYHVERTGYISNKNKWMEMKGKLKDNSLDSNQKEEQRKAYLRRLERNKKCIEASKNKLTRQDEETKKLVHYIQKNRLKD